MDGAIPFFLPVGLSSLVIPVLIILVAVVIVFVLLRIRSGRSSKKNKGLEDFVIVLRSGMPAKSYTLSPLAPPYLYYYNCEGRDLCLLLVNSPAIPFFDGKKNRNLYIAVEKGIYAMTVSPEELDIASLTDSDEVNQKDILGLVSYILEKKTINDYVVLPPNIRVGITKRITPTAISVIEKLMDINSTALSSILSIMRSASSAKQLAEAYALRAGAETRKMMTVGTVIAVIAVAVAIAVAIIMMIQGGK